MLGIGIRIAIGFASLCKTDHDSDRDGDTGSDFVHDDQNNFALLWN
jgi:hypothetical protein